MRFFRSDVLGAAFGVVMGLGFAAIGYTIWSGSRKVPALEATSRP